MTEKRVDIEVVDKVAPKIDDKILSIAKSAREAHDALAQLDATMKLIGNVGGKDLLKATQLIANAQAKAALAEQRLKKEIASTDLLRAKTTAVINKEIDATNKLTRAKESLAASKSAKESASTFSIIFDAKDKQNAQNFQAEINKIIGVNTKASKSARESASAFIEQAKAEKLAANETAILTNRANALKNILNPLDAAQKLHNNNLKEYNDLVSRNLISSDDHQRLVALSKSSYDRAARSISVMGNSATLSAFQLQNLSYQINDIIVGLYSGQAPLTVFIQQGLQIQQIFGEQGIIGALRGVGNFLGRFITVGTVAFASIAASVIGTVGAFNSFIRSEKDVAVRLNGLGATSKISVKSFDDLAVSMANAGNISISTARDIGSALIASGNSSEQSVISAVTNIKNLAATLQTDIEGAGEILKDLFANPENGIKKLNQQLNFADVATTKQINNLIAQGRAQDAVTLAIENASPALINASNATTGWSRAWDSVSNSISDVWFNFGRLIDRAIYGNTQLLPPSGIDAAYNKLAGQAQELVGKYDEWTKSINEARNALTLIDSAIKSTQEKLDNTFDGEQRENLNKFLVDLSRVRDIYDYMGGSLELFGNATARAVKEQQLEIQVLKATNAEQRSKIAREQELIRLAGQGIPFEQVKNAVNHAGNVIIETRNKLISDELGALREQNKLTGLVGLQLRVENELLSTIISKRQSGNALSQKEIETYRQLITVKEQNALKDQALNSIFEDSIGNIRNYQVELQATNEAFNRGYISGENYALRLNKISLAVSNLRLSMGNGDFVDATNVALGHLVSNYQGVLPELSNSFGDFFTSVQNGFADSIGKAIVMSEDLSDALHNIAQSALSSLISSLVKLGIQYAVNAALGQSIAISATAATAAQAALVAQAWAPAASLASLATSGANAAGAATALSSVSALAQSLALAVPAFATGGPVSGPGTGTSDSILALLSNGEFVVNAKAANENRPLLDNINRGIKPENIGGKSNININVINNSSAKVSVERISETEIRIIAEEEANKVLSKNGDALVSSHIGNPNSKTSRALGSNLTASRRR